MNIRQPHITGKTVGEQLEQVIAYLRNLSQQLQLLPEQTAPTPAENTADPGGRTGFWNLRVRNTLTLDGSINQAYVQSVLLNGTSLMRLQSRFSAWDGVGYRRQSFLLCGYLKDAPIFGVVYVDDGGSCGFSGTGGVAVSAESGGVVTITMPKTAYDRFLILSSEEFRVL